MIRMTHYDDGKGKHQSHEVGFKLSGDAAYLSLHDSWISDLSIGSVVAYGATKEEAIENLKPIMFWLFAKYKAIEKLYNSGQYEEYMDEVDGDGEVIKEKTDGNRKEMGR